MTELFERSGPMLVLFSMVGIAGLIAALRLPEPQRLLPSVVAAIYLSSTGWALLSFGEYDNLTDSRGALGVALLSGAVGVLAVPSIKYRRALALTAFYIAFQAVVGWRVAFLLAAYRLGVVLAVPTLVLFGVLIWRSGADTKHGD